MMLDFQGTDRVYHMDPEAHRKYIYEITVESEFPTTIYIEFKEKLNSSLTLEDVANLL